MSYCQEIDGCFGPGRPDRSGYDAAMAAGESALTSLRQQLADDALPLLSIAERRDDLGEIGAAAERLADCDDVLVLGTGGSSLGGKTLAACVGTPGRRPRLDFIDTVDPVRLTAAMDRCDPARSGLLVISKSGTTLETLTQLTVFGPWLRRGGGTPEHLVAITEPGDNPLRRGIVDAGGLILDHHPRIGGRYSCLSNVGLLPARIAGLDIEAVRRGAAAVLAATRDARHADAALPAVGAALNGWLAASHPIAVVMPYLDRLGAFAMWHRQLWAESLGKTGLGTTPAPAVGPRDQHSQLQLYLDGPPDKFYTLIVGDPLGQGPTVDSATLSTTGAAAYLNGRSTGDVLAAAQESTLETLIESGRPVRVLRLTRGSGPGPFEDGLDADTIGALLMHFMIETILTAGLLEVDPFDQPAVEAGKRKAEAYLGDYQRLAARFG